jgi:hypothetical protein
MLMPTVREGWRGRFFEDFAVGDVYRANHFPVPRF